MGTMHVGECTSAPHRPTGGLHEVPVYLYAETHTNKQTTVAVFFVLPLTYLYEKGLRN